MGRPRRSATILPLIALGACGGDEPGERPRVAVTDSAGVQVVVNHVTEPLDALLLEIEEELRIGSVEGPPEHELHLVRGVSVGPQDTIYVPLLASGEIRVYGPDGRHVRTLGGSGEGPGEFSLLSLAVLSCDTLLAVDGRLRRVTKMTTGGEVLGTVPIPDLSSGVLVPVSRTDEGWVVGAAEPPDWPPHGEPSRRRAWIGVVDSFLGALEDLVEGESLSEVVRPLSEYALERRFGFRMGPTLSAQIPLWEPSEEWAVGGGGRIHLARGSRYEIDVYEPSGAHVRRIRRNHEPASITPEMSRRYLEEAAGHHDTVDARTEFGTDPMDGHRFRTDLPTAPHLPPLGEVRVSSGGHVLVERPDLVEDPVALEWTQLGPQSTFWDLFDPTGRLAGTVRLPPRFEPHHMSRARIVGVIRDELGVQYVVRYRIRGLEGGRITRACT